MKIPVYQVDTFTERLFTGNPAAVCILDNWLSDNVMQLIAAENNLSETAFVVKREGHYGLRWFTPVLEVDLCGHATLGAAFVIFNFYDSDARYVDFKTRSGSLSAVKKGDRISLIFPKREASETSGPEELRGALGDILPEEILLARDYLVIYGHEASVKSLKPDMEALKTLPGMGVIVSAPGTEYDFVCRYFAPKAGIPEDPVTGSAYSTLVPYWAEKLGRKRMCSVQLSKRGGYILCEDIGGKVEISGMAVLFLKGEIEIDLLLEDGVINRD